MKKNLLFLITLSILISSCQTSSDKRLEVIPPFEAINLEEKRITINPSIQQVARFKNGVSVEIPKDAFSDIDGKTINEEVTLSLKTYNTSAQILASGIPMTYYDEGVESNFESAGMFEISGESEGEPIFIKEGKELMINYPSDVYGDYDFFHFQEESSKDSVTSGKWQKLSNVKKRTVDSSKVLDTFKLQFTEDYPELAPLSEINWKLATSQGNPNTDKNKWVLEQKWSSIEISQPRYGFDEALFTDPVNYDRYLQLGAIVINDEGDRVITSKNTISKIWNRSGTLIKTIDKVRSPYGPVEILDNKYIVVDRADGDYIYDLNGNPIGKLPESNSKRLAKTKDVIVYRKNGMDPSVYICDLKSKKTTKILLREDKSTPWEKSIYARFILSSMDQIITNSLDGIQFYDLEGNLIKQKEGKYKHFDHIKESVLLIECFDGSLILWDYLNNRETKSNPRDFDLSSKSIGNTYYASNKDEIIGTDYILINEANKDQSKLWNYRLNKTTALPFSGYYTPSDSLPINLIVGYNYQDSTFHVYDIIDKKHIITIPDLDPCFNCDLRSYNIDVSHDKKTILINSSSHVQYYSWDGQLIKDLKEIDSLIFTSGFISDSTYFTLSENGIYRIWNTDGTEISSRILKNEEQIYGWHHDKNIITYGKILDNGNYYNLEGDLLLTVGQTGVEQFIDLTQVIHLDHNNSAVLRNLFRLDTFIYQLLLRKGKKEFISYVYLDDADLQSINKYYSYRAKRINKERDRQNEELSTIRRFKLNKFGIYNWDKLIKNAELLFFAATFEFDVPVDFNHITIFHVTEINGRVVIKYDQRASPNFAFNPNAPNMLVAILPDNKTAVFDKEDFRSINIDQITKERAYKFLMKSVNEPIGSLMQLDSLIKL